MLKEFKEFALKGSVLDLAIGVIIGAAFNKIVSSLVGDIITPPLNFLTGRIDFKNLYVNLGSNNYSSLTEAKAAGEPVLMYGAFINNVIEFILIALVLFLIVRQINRFRKNPTTEEQNEKECPYCFTKIPIKASRCPHCTSDLIE
jgi:large conductance mechanosensitive channel